MNRATRWTLIIACLCCGLEGTAQELIAEKWTPELGMELTSELQLSTQPGGVGGGPARRL